MSMSSPNTFYNQKEWPTCYDFNRRSVPFFPPLLLIRSALPDLYLFWLSPILFISTGMLVQEQLSDLGVLEAWAKGGINPFGDGKGYF